METDSLLPKEQNFRYPTFDQNNSKQCRICLENDRIEEMIAPCACSGSQAWIHRNCLNQWRGTSQNRNSLRQCGTCLQNYQLDDIEDPVEKRKAIYLFVLLLIRDLTIFLIFLAFIYGISFLIMLNVNGHSDTFVKLFPEGTHKDTINALTGLILFFIICFMIILGLVLQDSFIFCALMPMEDECVIFMLPLIILIAIVGIFFYTFKLIINRVENLQKRSRTILSRVKDLSQEIV